VRTRRLTEASQIAANFTLSETFSSTAIFNSAGAIS
jgi:hypothetical protein